MKKDLLNELFLYDEGKLYWKVRKAYHTKIGSEAGSINNQGYRLIEINGKNYSVQKLVMLIHNIAVPKEMEIDHINQNRLDNRIENLRIVSRQENMKNKKKYKNNTTGYSGVTFRKGRYEVRISVKGNRIHLGVFKDFDDAVEAKKLAEALYGFHKNHSN